MEDPESVRTLRLPHAAGKLYIWKCVQCLHTHIDQTRLVKCSDHILKAVEINACFPPTLLSTCQKCGGDLNKVYAAQIRGCRIARQVSHDPAAEGDQYILAFIVFFDQVCIWFLPYPVFSVPHLMGRKKDVILSNRGESWSAHCIQIEWSYRTVCDNTGFSAREREFLHSFSETLEGIVPFDIVGEFTLAFYSHLIFHKFPPSCNG